MLLQSLPLWGMLASAWLILIRTWLAGVLAFLAPRCVCIFRIAHRCNTDRITPLLCSSPFTNSPFLTKQIAIPSNPPRFGSSCYSSLFLTAWPGVGGLGGIPWNASLLSSSKFSFSYLHTLHLFSSLQKLPSTANLALPDLLNSC